MAGVILKKPGQEPSPGEIADLVDLIKAEDIKVIFGEKQASKNIPNILVNETNAKLLDLDPLGGTSELDSYLKLMEYNLKLIKEGMCE